MYFHAELWAISTSAEPIFCVAFAFPMSMTTNASRSDMGNPRSWRTVLPCFCLLLLLWPLSDPWRHLGNLERIIFTFVLRSPSSHGWLSLGEPDVSCYPKRAEQAQKVITNLVGISLAGKTRMVTTRCLQPSYARTAAKDEFSFLY